MTREEFDSLVQRIEAGIGKRPEALRWRVALLAVLGYLGLLAWLFVVVLLSAAFFAVIPWAEPEGKVICGIFGVLVLIGGGFAALKVLLVRVPPPEGRMVTRVEVPELFAVLDDLQQQLQSVPFHRVIIGPMCNAAVVQNPRLGVFGWSRNYLIIGLPLLESFSRDEMRAVLAHEFAHLSRAHGRLTHWLYRLRRSWDEIFRQLSKPQNRGGISLRPVVVKYVDWFWPRFNAHAFVLSRANEYEADAEAARLTGKRNAGSALLRLAIVSHQLEEKFWPDLWLKANEQPEPPADVFTRLHEIVRKGPGADASRWIEDALRVTTTNSNTHPCLKERLNAMDAAAEKISFDHNPPGISAAEALLGGALEKIRNDVQVYWRKETEPNWRERHARAAALSHRLTSMEQALPANGVDADSLWDKALVLLDLQGDDAAKPLLQQILAARPNHVYSNFHMGRILLEAGNADGTSYLERAMAEDEQMVPQSCALLHEHFRRIGSKADLQAVAARLDRFEKAVAASHAERREVSARDMFLAHELSDAEFEAVRTVLAGEKDLASAHLARKKLIHFPTQKFFVLCVTCKRAWYALPNRDLETAMIRRLSRNLQLPGRLFVFAPRGGYRALSRKVRAVVGSEISVPR